MMTQEKAYHFSQSATNHQCNSAHTSSQRHTINHQCNSAHASGQRHTINHQCNSAHTSSQRHTINHQCVEVRAWSSTRLGREKAVREAAATDVGMRIGPVCWSCGELGHVHEQCPVMEVGTVIRVPNTPQATPDRAGMYQIPMDESDRGLGAVLSQEMEERPVLYISRKLSMRETKYSTIENECLAIKCCGPHSTLLFVGMSIHPLFGPHPAPMAPPHEGFQCPDNLLVSGTSAI
ncbi:uncharacterized protein LOC127453784 [Myxocyprinus asiaticus]|uniref:uncharacterized protein LOC127453784 n=1 Tax=Myxocyprinus asiaticus TaxID=70543 RepID=UPI0022217F1B|nr:uncharacterized protein LOC127453784 [Myxocyprinus asiaticus]